MPEPIVSRERIQAEAREAAKHYRDLNDACPYPFETEAARIFRDSFNAARAASNTTQEQSP